MIALSSLVLCLSLKLSQADHSDSGDPLDWLRESVPGEPGVDYPVFAEIQDTSFSCEGRVFGGKIFLLKELFLNQSQLSGYYADPEMDCQGYHVCMPQFGGKSDRKLSFLCPNGTIFHQELFTCDWW